EIPEQAGVVGPVALLARYAGVAAVGGEMGRDDPRGAAERIDLQPGVVRQAQASSLGGVGPRFDRRVLLEGAPVLLRFPERFVARQVAQADDREALRGEDRA